MFCKLGIHRWVVFEELHLETPFTWGMMFTPIIQGFRVCKWCGKHQEQDKHLLGVNPVEYHITWRDFK